jgi:predicted nucleic acid-binding protein
MSLSAKLLLDTDVLVDYLKGVPLAVAFLEEALMHSECYLSTITVAELYVGVREGRELEILDQFLSEFKIEACTPPIAKIGGLYRRDYGKSHGVGLADALIAATAMKVGARLVSLNRKHFPMLKDHLLPYQK